MKFSLEQVFDISAEQLYKAWLHSEMHTDMTGGKASIDPCEGGLFTCWDGYISGKNIELEPFKKIIQSWRTSEFTEKQKDSILEILFTSLNANKTKITLNHSKLKAGDIKYKQGWIDFYFEPMKKYFSKK